MKYKVLLEKMTPVYTLVTVEASSDEDAVDGGLEEGDDFCGFSHDRLPGDGVWSLIPPVDVFMAVEDGEPRVIGICGGDLDTAKLSCVGGNLVTCDGPHFVEGLCRL